MKINQIFYCIKLMENKTSESLKKNITDDHLLLFRRFIDNSNLSLANG
jgi:hypothetical protein